MKIKNIIVVLISIILIFSLPTYSNASEFSIDSIFQGADDFIQQGTPPSQDGLISVSKTISNILLTVAVAVTAISIGVMGITFATQAAEDKAKVKEAMVPWVIGIIVSFGAFGIWEFTINIFNQMGIS